MKGVKLIMTTLYLIRHSKPLKVNNDAIKIVYKYKMKKHLFRLKEKALQEKKSIIRN